MPPRTAPKLFYTLVLLGLVPGVGCQGWGNTNSYTRVPAPGTWGSASNSYYSLPGNGWTPAVPTAGAIGSGVSAGPAAAAPSTANPAGNKTTLNDSSPAADTASSTAAASSRSAENTVQPASASDSSNPVRIAVFSDGDSDSSQVVPAGNNPSTTIPAADLPWRNP